jgi:SAM-dependent methyltransferase
MGESYAVDTTFTTMNSSPSCPVCSHSASVFIGCSGVCSLWRCRCGLVFADRALWTDPYAASDYYDPAHQPVESYPLNPTATDHDRIRSVTRHITSGRLLDYGGGLGRTALAAHQAGFEASVLEDSQKAIADGSRHHPQITWIRGKEMPEDMPDASVDVITLFHVLEHLLDPVRVLRGIHRVLRPGGIVLIEVPNWGSHLRRLRGLKWQYVLDHHVNHFDQNSLAFTLRSAGFRLASVEYRRTFAINEVSPWKEPLKQLLCHLGFGEILRAAFIKESA